LSPMGTAMRMTKGIGGRPEPMPVSVPEALRAVVLKAMAREKEGRYARVVDLVADVDAYVGGFATSAEGAGVMRRVRLWVGREGGGGWAAGQSGAERAEGECAGVCGSRGG
jgi:hypothetical protein